MTKIISFILTIFLTGWCFAPAMAQNINTHVKVVLASNEGDFIDPSLRELIQELQSVLRYSSYRLLSQENLRQRLNETGVVKLPENRILHITPMSLSHDSGSRNRIELKLVITKDGKHIFNSIVDLLNHRSITVGGPKYQQGFLLFNITGSF